MMQHVLPLLEFDNTLPAQVNDSFKCDLTITSLQKSKMIKIISVESRIYESVNYAIIGLDNGKLPFRRQVIICTNGDALSIKP